MGVCFIDVVSVTLDTLVYEMEHWDGSTKCYNTDNIKQPKILRPITSSKPLDVGKLDLQILTSNINLKICNSEQTFDTTLDLLFDKNKPISSSFLIIWYNII